MVWTLSTIVNQLMILDEGHDMMNTMALVSFSWRLHIHIVKSFSVVLDNTGQILKGWTTNRRFPYDKWSKSVISG